jgi:aspartate-semialdehyde dehydrogenase
MKNYKLAIVGATGLVGRTALKVLEEKNFPNFEYKLFCSKKSAGTKVKFMEKEYIANELTENSFDEGFNFAIFSAGGETSKKFAPIAASKGCIVIDNSSAFRMDKNVPLVVPEVNPDDIFWNTGIIANPNCSTIQAVVALKPLDDKYKIKRIIYSTYQAVSGAGVNALEDLHSQASYNNLKKFSHPIYNNCLPHIDVFMDDGYTKEEHKMINETKKILGNENLKITATTVRVPIENCHGESINIEFEKDFNLDDVKQLLKNSKGIVLYDDITKDIYPIATVANGTDNVYVGRLRRDFSQPNTLNMWCVADNIRKGAASNAIQIMQKIIEKEV